MLCVSQLCTCTNMHIHACVELKVKMASYLVAIHKVARFIVVASYLQLSFVKSTK